MKTVRKAHSMPVSLFSASRTLKGLRKLLCHAGVAVNIPQNAFVLSQPGFVLRHLENFLVK